MEIIKVHFSSDTRSQVAALVKTYGTKNAELSLIHAGFHPSYVKALIKSILRKEGW
jgi:hypothetical protein